MQVDDPRLIEILTTLEMIDRANRAIAFHQSQTEPDANSIENYQRQKYSFEKQLFDLLKELNISLPKQEVA